MIRSVFHTESGQIPLEVRLALTQEEVKKACQLRFQVFVTEEKANLANDSLLEQDAFDEYCDHLIVIRTDTQEVIGTYRLLSGKVARKNIGFYSETEFDLSQLGPWVKETVELGRSCVKKEFRSGKVISLLWEGIGHYILKNELKYLIGCASMHEDAHLKLNEIYTYLKTQYAFEGITIQPQPGYKIKDLQETYINSEKELFKSLPPLIKGYLRLGAYICGEPAYDPVFKTIDFFMVLDRENIVKRYQNNYLKAN